MIKIDSPPHTMICALRIDSRLLIYLLLNLFLVHILFPTSHKYFMIFPSSTLCKVEIHFCKWKYYYLETPNTYPSSRPKPSQIKDTNIMIRLSFTLDYHKTRNLSTKFIGKTLYPIQLTAQIFQNRTILTNEYPNFINIYVILDLEFL